MNQKSVFVLLEIFNNVLPNVTKCAADLPYNFIGLVMVWIVCYIWNTANTIYFVASLYLVMPFSSRKPSKNYT